MTIKQATDMLISAMRTERDLRKVVDIVRLDNHSFAIIPTEGQPFTITIERDD